MMANRSISLLFACLAIALLHGVSGCTQSETPISSREEGFADLYLLGKWSEYEANEDGGFEVGDRLYDVSLDDNGDLVVLAYENNDRIARVYSGYSTRLEGKKYLNVRLLDCPLCNEAERAALAEDSCPYQIVQYSTFLPKMLATVDDGANKQNTVSALIAQSTAMRGQLLYMAVMNSDYVSEAIADKVIAGDADCETCANEGPCVAAPAADLQRFLLEQNVDIFSRDVWLLLVRSSGQ